MILDPLENIISLIQFITWYMIYSWSHGASHWKPIKSTRGGKATEEPTKNSEPREILGIVWYSGWWFQSFFYFHPKNWGRWTHFDLRIFFKWVGSNTNYPTSILLPKSNKNKSNHKICFTVITLKPQRLTSWKCLVGRWWWLPFWGPAYFQVVLGRGFPGECPRMVGPEASLMIKNW